MRKVIPLLLGFVFLGILTVNAQEVTLTPYGVSPYDVTQDSTEHYFDRTYTGLLNVGIQAKVYLQGSSTITFSSPQWNILSAPGGSSATFGTTKDIDTSNQVITFIPDVVGEYVIEFVDGSGADTVTLKAGLYLGVQEGGCTFCHTDTYNEWTTTNHSTTLVRGLNGSLSSHFGESCLECHATAYDLDAVNNGFDDFGFVFPDSLYPGVYDQMVALYPDAMKRANVQCESCHGPASEHATLPPDPSKIIASLSPNVCASCHEEGSHHIIPLQWDYSVHAIGTHKYAGPSRYTCTPCHNGQGFIEFAQGEEQAADELVPIVCASCHDPHSKANEHQLRLVSATLSNGFEFNAGLGSLCANCHKARVEAVSYVDDYLAHTSHYGPHHGPQADMLSAQNAYTWGQTLGTSPHMFVTENACVDCHMQFDAPLGQVPAYGGHTFAMVSNTGEENLGACNQDGCHSGVTAFEEKEYFYNGNADLDGDGTANGLQVEIEGLLDTLAMHLQPYGSTDINDIDSSWTLNEAAAYYNYVMVEEDRSMGIHNPKFTVELMYLSIGKVGGVVGVENTNSDLPTDFALSQNYPNPFNPSTTIKYSVPEQSNVKIVIYDAIGNQVEVLFDGESPAGNYTLEWNAGQYASGVYFYRMQADKFTQVKKMLLVK